MQRTRWAEAPGPAAGRTAAGSQVRYTRRAGPADGTTPPASGRERIAPDRKARELRFDGAGSPPQGFPSRAAFCCGRPSHRLELRRPLAVQPRPYRFDGLARRLGGGRRVPRSGCPDRQHWIPMHCRGDFMCRLSCPHCDRPVRAASASRRPASQLVQQTFGKTPGHDAWGCLDAAPPQGGDRWARARRTACGRLRACGRGS